MPSLFSERALSEQEGRTIWRGISKVGSKLSTRRNFIMSGAAAAACVLGHRSLMPPAYAADKKVDKEFYNPFGVRYNKTYLMKPYSYRAENAGRVQRFEVRSGDRGWAGDVASRNERAEIVTAAFRTDQAKFRARSRKDYWLSYAFMVEKGLPIISDFVICGQIHDISDPRDVGLPPPLCFVLSPSAKPTVGLSLQTRYDQNAVSKVEVKPTIRWISEIPRGQYVRLVTRVKFDPFGKGELQLWVNGREVLRLANIAIGYNNPEDQGYWQYGIYRRENANPLAVRYANMEQSPGSLIHRVKQPLSLPT